MSRLLRLAILCLLAGRCAAALAGPAEDFAAANARYQDGDFAAAYMGYEKLLADGRLNPDLLFNLGNASYRLGRSGEAALWYQRATTMDPAHREAQQNLRFLKRTGGLLQFETDSRLGELLAGTRSDSLLRVATTAGWLAALALAATFTLRLTATTRAALSIAAAGAALTALVAGSALVLKGREQSNLGAMAIVTAPGSKALTSPARAASAVIELPPGSQVAVVAERGEWRYLDLPGKLRGWVPAASIQPLWPYDPALAD